MSEFVGSVEVTARLGGSSTVSTEIRVEPDGVVLLALPSTLKPPAARDLAALLHRAADRAEAMADEAKREVRT